MTILSAGLMARGAAELQAAKRFEDRMIAFHLAEGAIDEGIVTVKTNRSSFNFESDARNDQYISGNYGADVTQSQNNSNVYQIEATGTVNSMGGTTDRSITAVIELASTSPYKHAVFANSTIAMSGNAQTDSYNSSEGPYDANSAGTNGDIGSNWTSGNAITLSGNVWVKGDAVVGPGADLSTSIVTSGNARIDGTRSAASEPKVLDPVTVPSSLINAGNLHISGNDTVTLPAGTFAYTSITITGNGKLILSGTTKIYMTGNLSVSGNGIGTAQNLPTNLEIQVQGNRTVSLSGNGNFYGAIYAPTSTINISGNGQLFGAVIGNTIADSGNGNIHFDEALESGGSSNSDTQLRSWSEL
ncbi:MAG: hypothetical protein HY585_03910 [Candidatus Omnitrophica bacterium]|nr:hypothetical protein [Candidatus Omnitrophota bacterium]